MTEQEAEFLKRLQARAKDGLVLYGVSAQMAREAGIPARRVEKLRQAAGVRCISPRSCIVGKAEHEFVRRAQRLAYNGVLPAGARAKIARATGIRLERADQLLRLVKIRPESVPAKRSVQPADELRMIEAAFAAVRS